MSTYRALILVLLAFAVSLGAVGVGAGTAWARCGRGSDCTGDLALGVAATAPAALLFSLMTLLLRKRTSSALIARLLLACAVGLAAAPLAAFVIRDPLTLLVVGALAAALVYLTVTGDAVPDAESWRGQGVAWRQDAGMGADRSRDANALNLKREREESEALAITAAGQLRTQPVEQRREAVPVTMSLCLLGVRDFEQLAAIYEMLCRRPETITVVVRQFSGTFAWLEVTVAAPVAWGTLVDALLSFAGVGLDPSRQHAIGAEDLATGMPPSDARVRPMSGIGGRRQPLRWRSRR